MKLKLEDLLLLLGHARTVLLEIPSHRRLNGMTRDLEARELRAFAFFKSSVAILNKMGAFKPGFLDQLQLELEEVNSDPEAEYQDWTTLEEEDPE